MVSDPIGDFITQLKNAGAVGKAEVVLPYSLLRHAVADKLVALGFLKNATKRGKKVKKQLVVGLAYENDMPRIRGAVRVSKPGRRLYANVGEIHPVKFGKGALIISTPKGILSGDEAKKERVGGEQLFKIW